MGVGHLHRNVFTAISNVECCSRAWWTAADSHMVMSGPGGEDAEPFCRVVSGVREVHRHSGPATGVGRQLNTDD